MSEPHSYGQGTSGDDFMRPFYWAEEVESLDERLRQAEAMLRLAWEQSWFNGPAPSYEDWIASLRESMTP